MVDPGVPSATENKRHQERITLYTNVSNPTCLTRYGYNDGSRTQGTNNIHYYRIKRFWIIIPSNYNQIGHLDFRQFSTAKYENILLCTQSAYYYALYPNALRVI